MKINSLKTAIRLQKHLETLNEEGKSFPWDLTKIFKSCEEDEQNQPDVDLHEAIKSEGRGPKNTMFPEAE